MPLPSPLPLLSVLFLLYAHIFIHIFGAHTGNHLLLTLCAPFLLSLSSPLTHSLSPPVCEISGVTVGTLVDLWLTLSGPLSGAGKALCAAACV